MFGERPGARSDDIRRLRPRFHASDWPLTRQLNAGLGVRLSLSRADSDIWKAIPIRIFYTFVIYQGYDMDILSRKSHDVIYHGYDMDIPNANNLELHILVIYFLTFGQIF